MIRKETVHIIWVTIQAGLVMLLLGACSTTKHLPEGEIPVSYTHLTLPTT